jgi:hypothetical protein
MYDYVEADLRAIKITNWKRSVEDNWLGRRLLSKIKPTLGCKTD